MSGVPKDPGSPRGPPIPTPSTAPSTVALPSPDYASLRPSPVASAPSHQRIPPLAEFAQQQQSDFTPGGHLTTKTRGLPTPPQAYVTQSFDPSGPLEDEENTGHTGAPDTLRWDRVDVLASGVGSGDKGRYVPGLDTVCPHCGYVQDVYLSVAGDKDRGEGSIPHPPSPAHKKCVKCDKILHIDDSMWYGCGAVSEDDAPTWALPADAPVNLHKVRGCLAQRHIQRAK